jgi:signal transduction histidine kinase/CheY-like chemotaxis protein
MDQEPIRSANGDPTAAPAPRGGESYPSWAWFGPALLSGLFLAVLGVLLYVMQLRLQEDNARAFEADAATAADAIRGRLDADRAFILALSDDLSRGALDEVTFQERVSRYVIDHPEILSVRWLSADLLVHRQAPENPARKVVGAPVTAIESARAIRLAVAGRRFLWTRPFDGAGSSPTIELWVPAHREGRLAGVFGAAFSCEGILRRALPPPLLLDYRLTLEDGLGGILATLPSADRVDPAFKKLVQLDPPGYGVSLLMERHGRGIWGWGIVVLAVTCFALAVGMGFGMWLLARSIAGRQRVEDALRESNEALSAVIERERSMEERLREAAKMEAVGRLAGGIAHDFNNLLTAILGYSDLLMHRLPEGDRTRLEIAEIHKAGERAAALTRQLLAFGRKQLLMPRPVDMRALVADMAPMLGHLVGDGVEVVVDAAPVDLTVHADPGQIGQAIINLASNARDAMPGGGRLTIALDASDVVEGDPDRPSKVPPGRYVMLSVRDTGRGIDEDTRAHLFEPFFTTKERGKGTGLGLSTVYGIVTQSGGNVEVDSAPGKGTEFRIRLPRIEPPRAEAESSAQGAAAPGAAEAVGRTVLVAEDESVIRTLVAAILERDGYKVLEAGDGIDALRIAESHAGEIDLLLTDVMMPRMGGKELAERLLRVRPGTKVLFMSGYAADALGPGALSENVAFLAKPFRPEAVSRAVRALLD